MSGGVLVPQPNVVLHGGGVAIATGGDGQLRAEEEHGLFARDTRMLSTYQLGIAGNAWRLLGRSRSGHGTGYWEFQNPPLRDPAGDIAAGSLLLSLRRRLDGALHDDLRLRAYTARPVRIRITLQLDADFADIFEVHASNVPPRLAVKRIPGRDGITLAYERSGFRRELRVGFKPSTGSPLFVGPLVVFDLALEPGAEWTCCLEAVPVVDGEELRFAGDPHEPEPSPVPPGPRVELRADPLLRRPFERGRADLHALAVPQPPHAPYVAAGVPWFLTLFGRDSLLVSLMTGLLGTWPAAGALTALGALQATARDDFRDAEPGKLPHELRRGELAARGSIPHSPYYGAHDAPALYCLALWHAWRWSGDEALLDAHLETARTALRWCDELGDRDGDGLLEYGTRSARGLRNQGWKDSGDGVVHADGGQAEPPLATVDLQGCLYAARLAMADLLRERGDPAEAERLRRAAGELRTLVEERFWLEDEGFYAFALDADKRPVTSIASNPGHLLWYGLPNPERAAKVAARLLEPDLFSGWGLRTLSTKHPAYNPLSYHLGSVWPHDTMLAAAGLWRYGRREEASTLIRAILDAAAAFEQDRLPELFCGLERPDGDGLPVPYQDANSPQAWAAAAPVLATQLFLGLVPDVPRGCCYVSPWLPEWLPRLALRAIPIGRGSLDIALVRDGKETTIEQMDGRGIELVEGTVEAPLWGAPATV